MDFVYRFPVVKGVQATREYYIAMIPLNLGPSSGFDIDSIDGEIVAECFAVTTATSNRKLEKDCSKLMSKAPAKQKYIYFYSRNDTEEKLRRTYDKYPEIVFVRIANFA